MTANQTRPALTLAGLAAIEDAWRPEARPDLTPGPERWGAEPYPLPEFLTLLDAAMGWLRLAAPVFCDCGAGPGAKVLLAAQRGCLAWGIEIVPGLAQAARQAGADVRDGNAAATDLGGSDIVFVNQLYRARRLEAAAEAIIAGRMRPGAVLIAVNTPGGPPGWTAVTADPALGRGAWAKPPTDPRRGATP